MTTVAFLLIPTWIILGVCFPLSSVIDVASATSATPVDSFNCNLDDDDLCGITQDSRNQLFWDWRGNSSQPVMGPVGDHTTGTTSGYYMFVPEVPDSQLATESSLILTPLFSQNSNERSLHFYYFMNGISDAGSLNAYILLEGGILPNVPDWSASTNMGNVWTSKRVIIPPQTGNYQIVFEGVRRPTYDGTVAIDDIIMSEDTACPRLDASADFEDGLNDFIQDNTDDMDWSLWSSSTPSLDTGPEFDHTYGNSSGHYLFIETSSPALTGHVARLKSPLLHSTKEAPRCLVFWYHMFGIDVADLNIYLTNGTSVPNPTYLWSLSGNRGDKSAGEVQLHSAVDFQVVIEGVRGVNFQGDIAIDDVTIDSQFCPGEFHLFNFSSITCNFEERELCYYEQDQTDDGDWTWKNRATDDSFTGPDRDHTTDTELGFFLFISESDFPTGGKARLWSPMADPQNAPSCVQFWYHMYGTDVETLNVYIKEDGQSIPGTPSWTMSGNQGNYWHRATVDVNIINAGFRVIFEGFTGQNYADDIAIDDVTFYNSTSCPIVTTDPPPPTTLPATQDEVNCDFESDDICGYLQLFEDEMDWIRYSGSTPSAGTGPSTDHTLGTTAGFYMYLECSDTVNLAGDVAHLASPYLNPITDAEPRCLEFYYHMWGTDIDMLNVYVVEYGNSMPIDPHLSLFGDRGNQWIQGFMDVPLFSRPYRVIFEASKGITFKADIAIDDIMFYEGSCPKVTPDPSVENANCDFEAINNTLCGYYQDIEDDFDWTLHSGGTNSDFTGPSSDHTLGTPEGHYLYIETSIPQRPSQKARLMSPKIAGNMDDLCLQFYYHMNGDDVGYLRIVWSATYFPDEEMLRIVGDQGDTWVPASVNLKSSAEFTFTFEALVGSGKRGDIAIDDIRILRQPCQGYPKESTCDFDAAGPDDLCGYQQSSLDDFDWQWYDGTSDDAPVNGDSAYVYFSPVQAQPGQTGKIVSPKIAGMSSQHCLDFDYVLYKDTTQQLIIAVMESDGLITNLQTLTGSSSANWVHRSRTLNDTEVGRNFQIIFIGIVGGKENGTGVIALDNPSIRLGKCPELHVPTPDTGEQVTIIKDDNFAAIVLGVLFAIVLLAFFVSAAFFVFHSRGKERDVPLVPADASIKYTNGETKNVVLPKDMTVDNPNYMSSSLAAVSDNNETTEQYI